MNQDPFGLGLLLYGTKVTEWHGYEPGLFALVSGGAMELAHAGCSMTAFCRNPLHPGPCKGWKKSLGTNAPGALKAIEGARAERLAKKRAATAEAKSTAAARAHAKGIASPLHAKKSTIKHANVLLGDDDGKASAKADKVILNKSEIKKYSKIKDAHINSVRAKYGLEQDTGLEERIADALAEDNKWGKDDEYRAVIGVSARSLGAQLAEKHCKEHDGDCDGKLFEGLREKLSVDAEHALLTGDDGPLDKTLADYEAGKLDLTPKAPKAKIPQGAKQEALAKAAAATPPEGAKAKKITIGQSGLQDGDKVWVYPTESTWENEGKKGTSWSTGGKAAGEPKLATVTKQKGNLGKAKNVPVYDFVGEDGTVYGGGTTTSKHWISPADKPEFDTPDAGGDGVPAGLTANQADLYKALKSGDKQLTKPKSDLGQSGGASTNTWWVSSKSGEDGQYVGAKSAGPTASALEKKGAIVKIGEDDDFEYWGPEGTTPKMGAKKAAPAAGADGFHAEKAKELFGGADGNDHEANAAKKLALLQAMSPEEFDDLHVKQKVNIGNFLNEQQAKWAPTGGNMHKLATELKQKLGTHDAPSSSAPDAPSAPKANALQDVKDFFEGGGKSTKLPTSEKLTALSGLDKDEYDKLGPITKAKINAFLDDTLATKKGPATKAVAEQLKQKFGTPDVPKAKSLGDLLDPYSTADHEGFVSAVADITPAEYDKLTPTQKALGSQLLSDAKTQGLPGAGVAQARWKTLQNGGKPPAPPAAAPAAPAAKKPEDISPETKDATDFATGAKSGTAKQKLTAYEKVSGPEFAQLDPDNQKLILADLQAIKAKFVGPKVSQAQAHHDYLSGFMGGGTGAGGGGNPGASAVGLTPEKKLQNAAAAVAEVVPFVGAPGSPMANKDPDALKLMDDLWNSSVSNVGHDEAASVLASSWAGSALVQLEKLHTGPNGDSLLDPGVINSAKPALEADIKKKLQGLNEPTPTWDAFTDAMTKQDEASASKFLQAAVAKTPFKPTSAATVTPTASPTDFGVFEPATNSAAYSDYQSASGTTAGDGILFSAFKSGHKGSVLSHSNEEIYNNLLAVAQHYKGKGQGDDFNKFPANLSVLKVAKAVDIKLAASKGVDNQNVLQKKMADWAETPSGKKYIAEHPIAGDKWADGLSGQGAGSVQAAKIGLVNGAPVGERAQKVVPSRNGKAPKFDASKSASDFKPLYAEQISQSQQDYMDESGNQWTPGETESLTNYTTGAYYELNGYLRGQDKNGNPIDNISDLGLERIALIQAGMRPLQQDTQLKRGTGWEFLPEGYRNVEGVKKLLGKTIQDHGFVSTTVGGEGGNFEDSVRLIIEAPKGTPSAWVKGISHNAQENEVVLAAGTRFRLVEIVQEGDKTSQYSGSNPTIIRVRVVG